jgi:NAD(P)-dependent dehydrogenase (short-subunit alcohol dehydrogenase family)
MSGRLAGKVAIVTGGASGIGRATCRLFGCEGATVIVADVAEAGGRAVAEEITHAGGRSAFLRLDATSEPAWIATIEQVLREHGRLDVLVNNAGVGGLPARVVAEHVALAEWNLIMAGNATSVMLGTKHAIPAMRRTGGGAIVNVASIYALVGSRSGTSYHASKGAARALTRATAIQYASQGIRINAVFPGFVETGMTAEMHARPGVREERAGLTPLGRIAEPEEIAPGILYLASDEASFVTGAELVIDGGMTAR